MLTFLEKSKYPLAIVLLAVAAFLVHKTFSPSRTTENVDELLPKRLRVFGIDVYGVERVEDAKMLHAANVLAEYLDNDEDGQADHPNLLRTLRAQEAKLIMWKDPSDIEKITPHLSSLGGSQDLGNDETRPEWHRDRSSEFDGSLEEIWHLIAGRGYGVLYPRIFGEKPGSRLAEAMDKARGGFFRQVPQTYPQDAWYTYDDSTCAYPCQVSEYFYWGMTGILGAQKNRLDEIGREWRLDTEEKIKARDQALHRLLTDEKYGLPTRLPDGNYPHAEVIKKLD